MHHFQALTPFYFSGVISFFYLSFFSFLSFLLQGLSLFLFEADYLFFLGTEQLIVHVVTGYISFSTSRLRMRTVE